MAPLKHALLFLGALLAVLMPFAAAQAPQPPPAVPVTPPPPAAAGNSSTCDPVKLSVCASVLNDLLSARLGVGGLIPGAGADDQCCPVIQGLLNLNVGACLCTAALRADVLGVVNLNLAPLAVGLLLVHCRQAVPANLTCSAA